MTMLLRRPAAVLALVLLVLGVVFPYLVDGYVVYTASLGLAYVVTLIGLNLLTGQSGQISLGHGAFMAIGAYTTALAYQYWDLSPYLGMLLGTALAVGVGALVGLIAARLRGLFLGLTTFGVAVSVPSLLLQFDGFTGGAVGVFSPALQAPFAGLTDELWTYYVALLVVVASLLVYRQLSLRRDGRAWRLLAASETAAQAVGIDVKWYKIKAFIVSAGYAGLAGGLLGSVSSFISPDVFGLNLSISLFVGLIIGGASTVYGPVIGGAVLAFLPGIAEDTFDLRPDILYGILLVAIVLVAPDGLAGRLARLDQLVAAAIRRRTTGTPTGASPATTGEPSDALLASSSKE